MSISGATMGKNGDAPVTNVPSSTEDKTSANCYDNRYTNRKELRVIGMSRSGNHAIIHWILSQAKGHTCYLNCAEGKTNPFVSARPLHNDLSYQVNYPGFNLEQEQAGIFSPKELLIHSYEDSFLGHVCNNIFEQNHDQWVGRSHQRYDVLILRDPYNLFASRKRAGDAMAAVAPATASRIWKQHAREFLGLTRRLRQPTILINYNRWVSEAAYRRQVAARLDLEFTDAGIDDVPDTGGGSSFDGARYQGSARKMQVLERWKNYQHDATYRQLLKPDLIEYAHQLFGPLPDMEGGLDGSGALRHLGQLPRQPHSAEARMAAAHKAAD